MHADKIMLCSYTRDEPARLCMLDLPHPIVWISVKFSMGRWTFAADVDLHACSILVSWGIYVMEKIHKTDKHFLDV